MNIRAICKIVQSFTRLLHIENHPADIAAEIDGQRCIGRKECAHCGVREIGIGVGMGPCERNLPLRLVVCVAFFQEVASLRDIGRCAIRVNLNRHIREAFLLDPCVHELFNVEIVGGQCLVQVRWNGRIVRSILMGRKLLTPACMT